MPYLSPGESSVMRFRGQGLRRWSPGFPGAWNARNSLPDASGRSRIVGTAGGGRRPKAIREIPGNTEPSSSTGAAHRNPIQLLLRGDG